MCIRNFFCMSCSNTFSVSNDISCSNFSSELSRSQILQKYHHKILKLNFQEFCDGVILIIENFPTISSIITPDIFQDISPRNPHAIIPWFSPGEFLTKPKQVTPRISSNFFQGFHQDIINHKCYTKFSRYCKNNYTRSFIFSFSFFPACTTTFSEHSTKIYGYSSGIPKWIFAW